MKAAKRFLSMLLTLCMLLSLLPSTVFAANSNVPLTDVKETDWFYDAVGYVYENGMMSGTGNNQFSPNVTTTRGMIVTILYRLEGSPAVSTASFDDVAAGEYYANGVYWAAANGVVSGYGNNLFGPNDPITREQMATILYRYVQYKEYETVVTGDVSSFTDGTAVSSYAVEPMNWAVGTGLLSGVGNNMIDPTGNATRAQAATILMRFCELDSTTSVKTYTVTFDYNYGNKGTYKTVTVEAGNAVDKPVNPSRSGYSFAGWYTKAAGGEKFDFEEAVAEDMTLYAHWNVISSGGGNSDPNPDPTPGDEDGYTVTFVLNDGSDGAYRMDKVVANTVVNRPSDPTRMGYTFSGWYTDPNAVEQYNFSTAVAEDLTLYAGWTGGGGEDELYHTSSGGGTICSITGIEMNGNTVEVTVNTNSISVLKVEFLEDDNKFGSDAVSSNPVVLTTVYAQTPEYCELVPVSIPVETELPQYFKIRATLYGLDGDPICDAFTSIRYTQAYEQFSEKTINDFPGQNVLNFDENESENFGVLADDVILLQTTETTNVVTREFAETDTETDVYFIASPDEQAMQLQIGDKIYAEGMKENYLFRIGTIEIQTDGTIRITPDQNVSLVDFYTFLNVSMLGEGSEQTARARQARIDVIDIDTDLSATIGGSLDAEIGEVLDITGKLTGTGTVSIEMKYDVHIFGQDYFYCSMISKLNTTVDIDVVAVADNSDKVEEELELAKIHIPTPVPGLTAYIAPTVPTEWKISGGGTFEYISETKSGFIYDTDSGYQTVDEKERTTKFGLEGEASIKIGPKVSAGIAFLERVVKGQVGAQFGIEAKAETEVGYEGTDGPSKHACALCIDGECKWFAEVTAELSFCIVDEVLEGKPIDYTLVRVDGWINFLERYPGQFYISLINSEDSMFGGQTHFGGGECPNKSWRTTLQTETNNGEAITDVSLMVRKNNGGTTQSVVTPDTLYLYDGVYTASGMVSGNTVSKSFVVNQEAQTVTLTPSSANGKLQGKISSASDGVSISGATILVTAGELVVASGTSDATGNYTLSLPEGTYCIKITKAGYIPFEIYQKVEDGRTTYLETAMMIWGNSQLMGGFSGTITDAQTGAPVSGVELKIRKGWNNPGEGSVIKTLVTDDNGSFLYDIWDIFGSGIIIGLPAGNYTLTASKDGYVTSSFNIIVLPGVVTPDQNAAISPSMTGGSYRVVLTWGETPEDLDSHFNGITAGGVRDHIYFSNKLGATGNLDVDDTTSYGPETITVTEFDDLKNGFTYSVHDYTNRDSTDSSAMSNSSATVRLYYGVELLRTYHIPVDQVGTVWNVFSVDGTGRITDLNTFESIASPEGVGVGFVAESIDLLQVSDMDVKVK